MTNKRIVAIMKDDKQNDSLPSAYMVAVFERLSAAWTEIERYYVNINEAEGISALRTEIRNVISWLGECRIAAGAQISGIVYQELDRAGFSIFEISQISPEILDDILLDVEEAEKARCAVAGVPMAPIETSTPGIYSLDLIKLQQAFPELSSKQALRPFLDNTPFYELRLICAHIPPWLEQEPYDIKTEKEKDGEIIAVVRKKQCGGG